jgi:uncharacterized protein YfaS (alpha-2-macroglobulin family)
MIYAALQANIAPGDQVLVWGVLSLLAFPLTFFLRSAAFAWGRKILSALAALLLAAALLLGALPILVEANSTISRVAMRGAVLDGPVLEAAGNLAFQAPAATPMAPDEVEAMEGEDRKSGETGQESPRLRQYFPETMLWVPEAETDGDGRLHLAFPVADSITTWRVTALASSQDGRLGTATAPLRVFQDFFIDLDLPGALTVGDEVAIPVGVFNYLPDPQQVRLEVEPGDWFDLMDEPVKEIRIEAEEVGVVHFRLRASAFGNHPFTVTARGDHMSDAIRKEVRVFPDGKEIHFTQSDRLTPDTLVREVVDIPPAAIPGTQSLTVKIYPGVLSQVVEGLDEILRMPFGCFEQTSSTTYPNVLVLDYLKTTGQTSPEVQLKAEEYINLGYQRLTTFEVGGSGGFSLFGDPPPDRMLTAYGLQEFGDMARVHAVDPGLVRRAAEWLFQQQRQDGAWENDRGLVHENTWTSLGDDRLPVTAYISWSLVEAGYEGDPRTQKGLAYVREGQGQADDPYVLALIANALAAADLAAESRITPTTDAALERLASMADVSGNQATWPSEVATFMGSKGSTGSIETTALAALAFLRADRHTDLANAALTALVQSKDSFGTWYSTQATVLSLKALIESVRTGAEEVNAEVTVQVNGGESHTVQVTPETFDVVQLLTFEDALLGQENVVEITTQGDGNLMYQIAGSYYLPWEEAAARADGPPQGEAVTIDVAYDRGALAVNDTVWVDVTVSLNEPGARAESGLIDLGLPPGFDVVTQDLVGLVSKYDGGVPDMPMPTIERFETTGRQILIYTQNLSAETPLQFRYRLRARYPLVVQTPGSSAYDYYNPDVVGESAPQTLVVR